MRVLAEEGGADLGARDRWGFTPLDEAERVGAGPVVEFLRVRGAPSGKSSEEEAGRGAERREGTAAAAAAPP